MKPDLYERVVEALGELARRAAYDDGLKELLSDLRAAPFTFYLIF